MSFRVPGDSWLDMEKLGLVRWKWKVLRVMESMPVGIWVLRSVCGECKREVLVSCIIHVFEYMGFAVLVRNG